MRGATRKVGSGSHGLAKHAKTPDHFSMIGGFDYLSGGAEEN